MDGHKVALGKYRANAGRNSKRGREVPRAGIGVLCISMKKGARHNGEDGRLIRFQRGGERDKVENKKTTCEVR